MIRRRHESFIITVTEHGRFMAWPLTSKPVDPPVVGYGRTREAAVFDARRLLSAEARRSLSA